MNKKYFSDLDFTDNRVEVIIVDIDGCLVADDEEYMSPEFADTLSRLSKNREVFLLSNKKRHHRNKILAEKSGVAYLETNLRKPSFHLRKFLRDQIINFDHKTKMVIGDKYLTDGLFAKVIGADFFKVKRLIVENQSFVTKVIYFVDDLSFIFVCYLKLIRPVQWLKNGLIFAPIIFAHEFFDWDKLWQVGLGVVIFSMLASGVYIFNDWWDTESDRLHPKKKNRPLASGAVSLERSLFLGVVLFLGSIFLTEYFFSNTTWLLILYIGLNILYSSYLKRVVILDIVTVAMFYLIRIIYGGLLINIPISDWLILCTVSLAIFIVVGKRIGESQQIEKRLVLDSYPQDLLRGLLLVSSSLTILSYAIYTISASSSRFLVYSNIPVLVGIFSFLYLIYKEEDTENPESLVFKNSGILFSVLSWLALVGLAVYY